MSQPATVGERTSARRARQAGTVAAMGLALVAPGVWFAVREFVAEVTGLDGVTRTVPCGSVLGEFTAGVRNLLSSGVFFNGRAGCDLLLGRALLAALASLSVGTLLAAVAAVRHRNGR